MTTAQAIVKIAKSVSIEPAVFLDVLALSMHSVVYRYGLYNAMWVKVIGHEYPGGVVSNGTASNTTYGSDEIAVQKATAQFGIYMSLAYIVPAIFADVLLGAQGDRYGRKFNMVFGILGTIIYVFPNIFICKFPESAPLYILIIGNVIAGFTGFVSIILISGFAYLADTETDMDMLTIRMAALQVAINIGQMLGPLLAGVLPAVLESAYQELVVISLMVVSMILIGIMMRQVPPSVMKARMMEEKKKQQEKIGPESVEVQVIDSVARKNRGSTKKPKLNLVIPGDMSEKAEMQSITTRSPRRNVFVEIFRLLDDVRTTFTKPREGHARAYLLVISVVFFTLIMAEMGLRYSVLGLFVLKAPLSWNQATLGYYDSAHGAAVAAGTLTGTIFLKKFLHFSDLMIILISLTSWTCEMLLIAFSTKTWMLFCSVAVGSMSSLVKPCSKSYVAKLVQADEVGKAYIMFGIAQNIAVMLSNLLYNSLYKATLEFFPGFPFIFAALVFFIAFLVVLGVYCDSKRDKDNCIYAKHASE